MEKEEIINNNSQEAKELFSEMTQACDSLDESFKLTKPSLNGERFLNNKQVCDMLFISPRTLQEYRDKGRIAFYKLEGKILFAESDILRMLEENYNQSWEQ